jgi:hypothetical protein
MIRQWPRSRKFSLTSFFSGVISIGIQDGTNPLDVEVPKDVNDDTTTLVKLTYVLKTMFAVDA